MQRGGLPPGRGTPCMLLVSSMQVRGSYIARKRAESAARGGPLQGEGALPAA